MTTFIVMVVAWILIGGITGAFAKQWAHSDKFGIWSNSIVGSVGGVVGGFIPRLVGISSTSALTLVTALLGAVLLLLSGHARESSICLLHSSHQQTHPSG